ncbi:hypothetical protein FPOAC2_01843 [Fusarium poae]
MACLYRSEIFVLFDNGILHGDQDKGSASPHARVVRLRNRKSWVESDRSPKEPQETKLARLHNCAGTSIRCMGKIEFRDLNNPIDRHAPRLGMMTRIQFYDGLGRTDQTLHNDGQDFNYSNYSERL